MSFFDLEVLKEKPIKCKGIMPHLKLSKIFFWDKNYNLLELMKIWSNFNHSKVLNY
jgi:hypothetical protein